MKTSKLIFAIWSFTHVWTCQQMKNHLQLRNCLLQALDDFGAGWVALAMI
ncbi:hypothetical protein ACG74X_16310 [Marivita sp. S0852]